MLQIGRAAARVLQRRQMAHICADDGRPLPAYAQELENRIATHGHTVISEILEEFEGLRKATPDKVTHDMWEAILASCVACGRAADAVSYYDQAVTAGYFQGPEYTPVTDEDLILSHFPSAVSFRQSSEASINAYAQQRARQLTAPPSRVPPYPSNSAKASVQVFLNTLLRSFFYKVEDVLGARLSDDQINTEVISLLTSPLFAAFPHDVTFGQLSDAQKNAFVNAAGSNDQLATLLVSRTAPLPGLHASVQAEVPRLARETSTDLQNAFTVNQASTVYDLLAQQVGKAPPGTAAPFPTEQVAQRLHDYIATSVSDSDPGKAYMLANNARWTDEALQMLSDPRMLTGLRSEQRLSTQHLDQDEECRKAQLEHEQQLLEADRRYAHYQSLSKEEQGRIVDEQEAEIANARHVLMNEALPAMELLKSHVPQDRNVDDEDRQVWDQRWAFLSSEADRYAAASFRFNGTTELDRINDFLMTFHQPEKRIAHRLYFAKQIILLFGYKPLDWFLASSFGITPPGYYLSSSPDFDEFTRSLEACPTPDAAIAFLQARIPTYSSN